jgi:neutral ceramidase
MKRAAWSETAHPGNRAMRHAYILVAALAAGVVSGRVVDSAPLRLGRAVVDITPVPGTPMLTPQSRPFVKLAEPAHDPLCVRAVVIEVDGAKAAIAACDLTSIPNAMFDEARKLIVEATGLPADSIMISATHTHTAPQIRPRFLGKVDEEARKKCLDYVEALPGRMADAVIAAHAAMQPCRVSAGIGREDTISFNRRFVMRDGTVMTNPGKDDPALHAQIVRPAGPTDPEVGVVSFDTPDGKPLATLVNFSLHLDTDGGAAPTADFAGTLHQRLVQARGAELLSLFAIGAAGNINHYNLLDPQAPRRVKGHEESARIGHKLADAVLETYSRLQPLDAGPLRFARRTVAIDMPREKGAALAARHQNAPRFFDGEVDVRNENGRQWFEAEVQVITLGSELAWVGLPGEMFVEFGLALKLASPYRYTMIHELANRSIGYVPNLRAYPEGAYETLATRCAPGSGEDLVAAATQLLVTLKHQQTP